MIKKIIIGIVIVLLVSSGLSLADESLINPPNIPSEPHPEDGAIDIGIKTHLSWTGGDPDAGDKAVYDIYFGTEPEPELLAIDLQMPNYNPDILEKNTQYYWKVIARDENQDTTSGPIWTFTTNDCDCNPPDKPSGPVRVRNRNRYEYTTKIMNQNQDGLYYNFSWGDSNCSGWLGPYNHNERVRAEHQWEEPGEYQVQTRGRFQNNMKNFNEWVTTGWSEPLLITVTSDNPTNEAPTAPEISGSTSGKAGVEYDYTFVSTDPNSDDLYYVVSWGCCGTETHTYGPYASGEVATVSHSWQEQGTFTITVKAKDVYELEGPESIFAVTMPRSRDSGGNQFMQRIRNMVCDMLGICQGGCELEEITGILTYEGSNFFIGSVELHFGPNWYITAAIAAEDYDGDGEIEQVYDELMGLVGLQVTVEGHMQSEDWMSVFTINSLLYREQGQPVWAWEHHWRWRNR